MNGMRYYVLPAFLISYMLTSGGCGESTEPESEPLIADAGLDQTTLVGSYAILDGSGSSLGGGEGFYWCEWTGDKNNPAEVFLLSGEGKDHLIQTIGFIKEGTYKFTLVLNNGIQYSEPDEVVVTVSQREQITFEDPSFEVYVRYALKKPTEELTESALLSLDSLDNYSILVEDVTSLAGIEKCTNLEYLAMGLQQIADLTPLANLTKLEYLNLTQNRHIKDISPLAGLIRLRYLDLDSNEITDISPLANLTQLTYLNLMFNVGISDISVIENMKDLEELWLSNSPIGDISPIAELTKLSFLWLSKCQLQDITPVTNLTNLRLLFSRHNSIVSISPVEGLTNLERLYLSDNQIDDVSPLVNLTSLPYLVLDVNQIEDISPLKHLTGLGLLGLTHNQIVDIGPLVENTDLGSGDVVGLSHNPLNDKSINEYIPTLRARGVNVLWP